MHRCVIVAIDSGRRWARLVTYALEGIELSRTRWCCQETAEDLVHYLCQQREYFGVPVLVAGRCTSRWPGDFFPLLSAAHIPVELYGGPPLRRLLRLERAYREDVSFGGAGVLAAICIARHLGHRQQTDAFVAQWCYQLAQQRAYDLRAELQSMAWAQENAVAGRALQREVDFRALARFSTQPVQMWSAGGQP